MGLFFGFGQVIPEIFEFQCSKKGCFFRQDLKRTIWNGTKNKIFDRFFTILWEKKLITLSKMTQNLKINACFMQNIMELDMKKLLDPKAVTSGVWGLKTW